MTVSHRSMEHQADRIETVLASHKISARVWGGVVLPRFCRYQLTFASGTRVDSVTRLAEEMALSLGVPAVRVWRENAAIQVEVPRPGAGRTVPLDDLLANVPADRLARRGLVAALGLDENGMPLLIRIDSPDVAHVLIVGTTGSGKTVLARTILASLVEIHEPADLSLLLIDPKGGRGYNPFAGLPHLVGPIATDPDAGEQALAWLVQTMEQRDAEQRSTPHIVCAIDELADLLITGGKPLQTAVVRLAQRGREAGIHLVACTQRPAAEVMSGFTQGQLPRSSGGRRHQPGGCQSRHRHRRQRRREAPRPW
jgi:S-DNA-T family DNA segregation ATPase FtsK/SpoIIIE